MDTLSVCIVTKNEEHNIVECLERIKFADEIIIVDAESTDKTVELCKQYTNKIVIAPWPGCGPQKKRAVSLATCDWVLLLDADERISTELQQEIIHILKQSKQNKHYGYKIRFQSYFCNTAIRFGDWFNESHLRLFRRNAGKVIPRIIHFRVEVTGSIGKLKHKVNHYSFPNLHVVLDKMNSYSSYGAKHKQQQHLSAGLFKALVHGVFAFVRGYILKLGFLDGRAGFILAVSIAEGSYYKYLKLHEYGKPNYP